MSGVNHSDKPPSYSAGPVDTTQRLQQLRALFQDHKIDCYVVPSGDAHGSEYVAPKDKRQRFISGFTGEASTAIIDSTRAALFVDGRYHVQAAKEIDRNWTLYKVGLEDVPTWTEYLEKLDTGTRVALDATLFEISVIRSLKAKLDTKGIVLVYQKDNLVDKIRQDKPAENHAELYLQEQFAGKVASEKIADVRAFMNKQGAHGYLVHNLAEIAWLLNLRGGDIPYSPVFESYLLIAGETVTLYVDQLKIKSQVARYLQETVKCAAFGYESVWSALAEYKSASKKCIVSSEASWAALQSIGEENAIIVRSPIELAKSVKNETEIAGMKAAYSRDGLAWCQWLASLEKRMKSPSGRAKYTEWDAAQDLTRIRREVPLFVDLAYENISATAGNAGPDCHVHPCQRAPFAGRPSLGVLVLSCVVQPTAQHESIR